MNTTDLIIRRLRSMDASTRTEFLHPHSAAEILAIHQVLVGEPKPKTPRPVLERRVLAALASEPPVAQDEPAALPPQEDAQPAPAQLEPSEPATAIGERLPGPGSVIVKRDRHGAERCRCTVLEGGRIDFEGTVYKSISAAAVAAAKQLGLTSPTANGYVFWGLAKRQGGAGERPAKDHGPALQKAWERYAELARTAIAANPGAVASQLGAQCNAHNELVAAALAPAA